MFDPKDPTNMHGQLSLGQLRTIADQAAHAGGLTAGGNSLQTPWGGAVMPAGSTADSVPSFVGVRVLDDGSQQTFQVGVAKAITWGQIDVDNPSVTTFDADVAADGAQGVAGFWG